jgi:nucleoside-diphosphate-sugar epimerase
VQAVVEHALRRAGRPAGSWTLASSRGPAETGVLQVRSDRAARELGWSSRWNWREAVDRTVGWHLSARGADAPAIRAICAADLAAHGVG